MRLKSAIVAAAVLCGGGCVSDGLSPRQTSTQDYSTLVYSGYPAAASGGGIAATQSVAKDVGVLVGEKPVEIHAPISLAIVQAGEISPPQGMIDELQARGELFSRVQGLPEARAIPIAGAWRGRADGQSTQGAIGLMRQASLDAGADYLLFIGGTIDHGTEATPLSLLDLTIVGAWLVPSRLIHATGKVSASLIDARTGRVVMVVSGEAERNGIAPTVLLDGAEERTVKTVRDDLVRNLTKKFVSSVERRKAETKG
jgi:hypothetical protein